MFFLSKPHFLCVLSGLALCLSGCGGNDATDRINTTSTASKGTYTLTMRSPVTIKNASVTLTDTISGTLISTLTFNATGANDLNFAVPTSYADNNRILLAELKPADNATYYDPALDAEAPLNQHIHALIALNKSDLNRVIDPFSEIVYQRTLIRSGQNTIANADISQITYRALDASRSDVLFAFRENQDTNNNLTMNSKTDLAALTISATDNRIGFQNKVFAAGLYALQHNENPSDTTPYLTFMKRAALDMQDGDLDGFTIVGNGDSKGRSIANALVTDATDNTDPATSTQLLLKDQPARSNFANRLQTATQNFFMGINQFKPMQTAAFDEIENFNYLDGNYGINPLKLHSLGAGNYTRAFGLVGTTFKNGIFANESYGDSYINDIEALIGNYSNGGCTLNIRDTGAVTLTNGSSSKTLTINGEAADNLTALGSGQYLLNIGNPGSSPIEFIQLSISGNTVNSAAYGTASTAAPTKLDSTVFSCTF